MSEYGAVRLEKLRDFQNHLSRFATTEESNNAGGGGRLFLPVHLILKNVFPFLDAYGIFSLRRSCKQLYCLFDYNPPFVRTKLFPHQKEALKLMEFQEAKVPRGGIYADEPGLGKTLTVISLIASRKNCLASSSSVSSHNEHDMLLLLNKKRPSPSRVKKQEELKYLSNLPSAKTNLIVVPVPLVEHWLHEFKKHTVENQFTIYVKASPQTPWPSEAQLFFIDVLLTTYQQLSLEKNMDDEARYYFSTLFSVKYYRMIIDESHVLGNSSSLLSNYQIVLSKLQCERKWILTGTPAAGGGGSNNNKNSLKLLLNFVNHSSLKDALIRFEKKNIRSLPQVAIRDVVLSMPPQEKQIYNMLVGNAKLNLLLTDIGEFKTQSILNNRSQMQRICTNIRLACVFAYGLVNYSLSSKNYNETVELFKNEPDLVKERCMSYLDRVVKGEVTSCCKCGRETVVPLITKCAHFICVECFDSRLTTQVCFECGKEFDGNEFAYLQPGFDIKWVDVENTAVSRKVQYVIQTIQHRLAAVEKNKLLQSATTTTTTTTSPKFIVFSQFRDIVNIVGHQLIQAFGEESIGEFWGKYRTLELNKFVSNKMTERKCNRCNTWTSDLIKKTCDVKGLEVVFPAINNTEEEQKKNFYFPYAGLKPNHETGFDLQSNVVEIATGRVGRVNRSLLCESHFPSLHLINQREMYNNNNNNNKEAQKHQSNVRERIVNCHTLLLSQDGAVGLDLHMVDYIFFLDTVWNHAMEEQIIARAHRLGNTHQTIQVDNLLYDGTIEWLMKKKFSKKKNEEEEEEEVEEEEVDDDGNENPLESLMQTQMEKQNKSKMRFLLRNLKLVD